MHFSKPLLLATSLLLPSIPSVFAGVAKSLEPRAGRTVGSVEARAGRTVDLEARAGRTVDSLEARAGRTVSTVERRAGRTVDLEARAGRTVGTVERRAGRTFHDGWSGSDGQCMSWDDGSNLVAGFASLLTGYTADTAEKILASDFVDTSQSINVLGGYPLDGPTFPSKAAFEAGQGTQPAIGLDILMIDAITCDTAVFRWEAYVGTGAKTGVKGINVLKTKYDSNLGWQISQVFSEFNSITWYEDLGGVCSFPQ